MTCEETRILLHALIDGELDAGHAREVEAHVASCPALRRAIARLSRDAPGDVGAGAAPPGAGGLRARIEGALPAPPAPRRRAAAACSRASPWAACSRARWPRAWSCS